MKYQVKLAWFMAVVMAVVALCAPVFARPINASDPQAALVYYQGDYGIESVWGDGSHHQTIISGFWAAMPDVSPDGKYLVFCTYAWETGVSNLVVYNIKAKKSQIVATGSMINDPSWSPDGNKIVFADNGKLYVVNVTNLRRPKPPVRLTDSEWHIIEYCPDWGNGDPDLIAYQIADDDGYQLQYHGIVATNPITKETISLVSGDSSSWVIQPALSPDGTKLAYTFIGDENTGVYVKEIDDPGPGEFIIDGWAEAWHPSGQGLFVNRSDNMYYGIYYTTLDGQVSKCLTNGWAWGASVTWNPGFRHRR